MLRVLCPVDYSKASQNALNWALNYLVNLERVELHLVHCVHGYRGGTFYLDVDEVLHEQAESHMEQIVDELPDQISHLSVIPLVAKEEPKSFLIDYIKNKNIDLVILGSQGLTNLKDITVGSVTEYLIRNSRTPIIAIPKDASFGGLNKIVFALGREEIKDHSQINKFNRLFKKYRPNIHMTQVLDENEESILIDKGVEDALDSFDKLFTAVPKDDNISESITEYAEEINADLICFVHIHRNWFAELVHHSVTKEELFDLEVPILVLHA